MSKEELGRLEGNNVVIATYEETEIFCRSENTPCSHWVWYAFDSFGNDFYSCNFGGRPKLKNGKLQCEWQE